MVAQTVHPNPNSVHILGVDVSLLDMEQTLALLQAQIASREPSLVVTANATALVIAHDDPRFLTEMQSAKFVTVDGSGLQWAIRRKGHPIVPKVTGVDLVERLCVLSVEHGYRIAFVGGEPGVAELAADNLKKRFPGCNIVLARHGYFKPDEDAKVAEEIAIEKPDVLFVAMGMPRQERFILSTLNVIQAPIAVGVGGSLDVFSGRTKRAPKIIQKLHLEWLWRSVLNPSKFKKLTALPRFIVLALKEKK